ncbi:hypothetical protein D7030_05100 [Flavobacteriaceae bacterium AU392]|nr:hypothetical protein D1817_11575 [Flavobacteriaceae bacterium]RKM86054.1 hypothetical protein D7030_05100 [Flavobacteriaceae bacterium AU392]
MKNQNKLAFLKKNKVHIYIWLTVSLFSNIRLYETFGAKEILFGFVVDSIFLFWIVFSHLKWGLPYLVLKSKKYLRYFLSLVLIVFVSYIINHTQRLITIEFFPIMGKNLDLDFLLVLGDTFFDMLPVVIVSSLIKLSFDFFKLQAKQKEIENQRLETELKYLKLQISPHFLFNTLNNLLFLTNTKSDQASKVVEKLAYLMRYLLEKDRREKTPLMKEVEFVKAYIELEQIRIKNIDVSFDIDGNIDKHQIAPALLITLVENAFKHGVKKADKHNYVYLELIAFENKVHFKVTNPLRNRIKNNDSHSIGLRNLRKRLDLIYPNKHTLITEINEGNTFTSSLEYLSN